MRKNWLIGAMGMAAFVLVLAGCEKEEIAPGSEEREMVVFKQSEVKDKAEIFHTSHDMTIAQMVIDDYLDISDEYISYEEKKLDNVYETMTPWGDEVKKREALFYAGLNRMAVESINLTLNDIEKEVAEGKGIRKVIHAVVYDYPEDMEKDAFFNKVTEALKEVTSIDELRAREDLTLYVDFLEENFGKHNILSGFEDILEMKKGDIHQYGNDSYTSFVRVMDVVYPTDMELLSIYSESALVQFSNIIEIVYRWLDATQNKVMQLDMTESFLYSETAPYLDWVVKERERHAQDVENTNSENTESGE